MLGFSNVLFPSFYKNGKKRPIEETVKQINIAGINYTAIVVPECLEHARKHFNCSTLEGVPLENGGGDGSAGSHWEKLYLSNTYMNSVTEFPGYMSNFTLSLLNGSGWYFVS